MEYRFLGKTNIKVSKICLGTMTYGQQNTEAEAHEQMDYAITQGINFFDTAELYAVPSRVENNGLTEKYMGTWFQSRKKRQDIVLATKITGPNPSMPYIRTAHRDFSKAQLQEAVDGSLERLQTDYIDLYQLHWPERQTNYFGKLGYTHNAQDTWEDNFVEVLEGMNALIQSGKIRYWGLSNETAWGLMHFMHLADKYQLPAPVCIQNPYSLLNRTFEVGLAECALRENCGLLAYSPMAFGLLSGKYHRKEDTPNDRINQFKNLSRYNSQYAWSATEKYLALSEKYGLKLSQMALAYVTQQPFTTSTIIGATSMNQLIENIDSANLILSADVLKDINTVHTEIPNPAP